MPRIVAIGAGSGYVIYVQREAIEEAYWQGRGAELLHLEWERVRAAQVDELSHGRTRKLYDCVVHAPKSLSLVSMTDERLLAAHRQAVAYLMGSMENYAAAHYRGETILTGNLLMAAYEHRLSRARDVHVHTHVLTVNMTDVDGEWYALRAGPIYRNRHELTEIYRTALARRVMSLGYEIRERTDRPVGWEIEGIPQQTIDQFSQRHRQIQEAVQKREQETGIPVTKRQELSIARESRRGKDYTISPTEIRAHNMDRLTDAEHSRLEEIVGQALSRSQRQEIAPKLTPETGGQKAAISNWEPFEKAMLRHPWEYGADTPGDVMVSNRPRRVMRTR